MPTRLSAEFARTVVDVRRTEWPSKFKSLEGPERSPSYPESGFSLKRQRRPQMTTATMEVKKAESAWTPEQEARIAQLMETEGISRPAAVRKMKAGNKPASQSKYSGVAPKNDRHSKVPVKPAKTAPKPKEA